MGVMDINSLCSLFDRSEIVNTQVEIDNREYYASLDSIFTDGEYKTTVGSDAYIHISSVQNASYLIFVDIEYKIYLCVYKFLPTTKYKNIKQKLQILKNLISDLNTTSSTIAQVTASSNMEYAKDDIVDINIFTCTECNSTAKLSYNRLDNNPDVLSTKCPICKTEYTFVPSKYYKLASKRIIYHKTEKTSRNININNK